MNKAMGLAAGVLAFLIGSGITSASAQDFVYGAYMGPKHKFLSKALQPALEDLAKKSEGSSQWRIASGGQLLSGKGTLDGLKGGSADAGAVVPAYFRSELPASAMLFDYVGPSTDIIAATGAMLETMLKNCPRCLSEYKRNGTRFMAAISASRDVLMCKDKVKSLSDIAGKKVRAVGFLSRIAETLNAVPVNMSPPDGVTAMQRGTIDCTMGPASWLTSYGYQDVVTSVLDYNFGFSLPLSFFVVSENAWQRMSAVQQNALWSEMPALVAHGVIDGYLEPDAETLRNVEKAGITVTEGGDKIAEALADYFSSEDKTVTDEAKKVGLDDGQAILDTYKGLLPKWEKISEQVGQDPEKFAKALAENIYNQR